MRAERLDWEQVEGEWKEIAGGRRRTARSTSGGGRRCAARSTRREGGAWRVTATVTRRPGSGRNQSQLRLWVAGGKTPPPRTVEQEKVTLIPDKKEYRAGETAEVLVLAPFAPAEGVLTLRRSGHRARTSASR